MEPMALGSPVSSPVGACQFQANSGQGGSQYLPGYLMGDVSSSSGGRPFQTSPIKMMRAAPSGFHPVSPQTPLTTPQPARIGKSEKPGGPPVQRLFTASAQATPNMADVTPMPTNSFASFGTAAGDQSGYLEDSDAGVWVTIFGFPPSAASYVLTQASLWGHVMDHRIPSQGNWIHLKFASRLQARKALARNGRLLTDTLMVGVVPCTDSTIIEEGQRRGLPISSTPAPQLTATPKTWDRNASFAPGTTGSPTVLERSNLRPLTQAYKGALAEYEVTQQRGTPQQNTSLVSKAMELVFGW